MWTGPPNLSGAADLLHPTYLLLSLLQLLVSLFKDVLIVHAHGSLPQ